jgi:hypothetical protein
MSIMAQIVSSKSFSAYFKRTHNILNVFSMFKIYSACVFNFPDPVLSDHIVSIFSLSHYSNCPFHGCGNIFQLKHGPPIAQRMMTWLTTPVSQYNIVMWMVLIDHGVSRSCIQSSQVLSSHRVQKSVFLTRKLY